MKKVLVLGAGLVSKPLVHYLLERGFEVTVATRTVSKALKLVEGYKYGKGVELLVDQEEKLRELISDSDLVVSLLPYTYHPKVAKLCLELRKHLVTTSYVSDAMRELDSKAREVGVIFLNEIGVDPGIDHMTAMRIIDKIKGGGGEVLEFRSYCGGLPAPEANDNPMGYKFSWSPIGVIRAGKNSALYLEDGKTVEIPPERLFVEYRIVRIEGAGEFECYGNRNSLVYIDLYGLKGIKTMFRGTLRYKGWCPTLAAIYKLGLGEEKEMEVKGLSYKEFLMKLIGKEGKDKDVREEVATYLGLDPKDKILDRLEWLGLFSDQKIEVERIAPIELLVNLMQSKMQYKEGERDMIVLYHEFIAKYRDGSHKRYTSTMIDYGIVGGDTSMARTVSLPAAIAVRLILEGKLKLSGVHIPVLPEIYNPVLDELEELGIKFIEREEILK